MKLCQGDFPEEQNYEILSSSLEEEDKGCRCKRLLIKLKPNCQASRSRVDGGKQQFADMAVIVGIDQETGIRRKIVLRSNRSGLKLATRLKLYLDQKQNEENKTRFLMDQNSEDHESKEHFSDETPNKKAPERTISTIKRELAGSPLGWPLLRRKSSQKQPSFRKCSSLSETSSSTLVSAFSRQSSAARRNPSASASASDFWEEFVTDEDRIQNSKTDFNSRGCVHHSDDDDGLKSSPCKLFSHGELKKATQDFSPQNLVGEGGCSSVYKGCLPDGKSVAVKVLKPYKEAWNDFSLEVEIMSLVKHRHITPLIGVCIEGESLMLVYDFLSNGSLEESLQDDGEEKAVLPWEVRFRVAVEVAEALSYLHSECPRPVIHRDVKSSNILLSSDLQPQLSDFGLAIWGPANSTHMTNKDLVGTFGYIAPEYFMHGRVSEKVDIYSFGIVLLELVSGRKAIITNNSSKAQEGLVKWVSISLFSLTLPNFPFGQHLPRVLLVHQETENWSCLFMVQAIPLMESGNHRGLLDPRLMSEQVDNSQLGRMVLAATLCTKASARLRPTANQIIELLKGVKCEKEWTSCYINYLTETSNQEEGDDESLQRHDYKSSLDTSWLDLGLEDATQLGSSRVITKPRKKLKDYLKEDQF
ncbi:unnamed protein product [Linum tenue]|uniref:Protein kinase domain-containing protein n=1 Tax=Linum tenue TaxID=586396 RepID=A0AAV0LMM7_9ROSI|nr:unnamed protein product [Linum tenue]